MAESTTTRKVLRRAIARTIRMEFFRRYSDSEVSLTGTPTSLTLPSTALTQVDDFWNGGWVYIASGNGIGQERRITDFAATTNLLTLEYALTTVPAATDKIEILDTWSASDIHSAINRAIGEWGRLFFDSVEDKTLVYQEDKMEYSLTGLAKKVWALRDIRVERSGNAVTGVVDSATYDETHVSIVDAERFNTDDQYNGYKISIYDGTGAGQVGDVVDTVASSHTVTVLVSQMATSPAAGSKYRLWDATEQINDSWPLANYRTDAIEYPDTLYLNKLDPSLYGMRMYLRYLAQPSELTSDTTTTTVPKDFIVNQALAYLHESMMHDNRSDANRHANMAQYFRNMATEYRERFSPRQPGMKIQVEENTGFMDDQLDPLGWRS
jgi:hypothetical protein